MLFDRQEYVKKTMISAWNMAYFMNMDVVNEAFMSLQHCAISNIPEDMQFSSNALVCKYSKLWFYLLVWSEPTSLRVEKEFGLIQKWWYNWSVSKHQRILTA